MAKQKVLFITTRGQRHQKAAVEAAPQELEIVMRRNPSKQEVLELLPGMDFLISERSGAIDREIIEAGRNLKVIQRLGTQTWDIDAAAARQAGTPVCYLPIETCIFVAEHMLMLMLALGKRLRTQIQVTEEAGTWELPPQRCNEDYFAFNWSKQKEIGALQRSTVGLLGFGEISTELARRLKGFGCTVLYNKRSRLPAEAESELGITYADRDELAGRSDFLGCLLPNLPELNQSIDAKFFSSMKPGAMFVHCGAPGVVNEDDLIAARRSGQLGGAAIDCFTYEPLRPDDPLLALARDPSANVILTPHIAAGTVAANRDERVRDYINIVASMEGRDLQFRLA